MREQLGDSHEGMSTRVIAPIVGVQHSAVAKDLRKSGVSDGHTSRYTLAPVIQSETSRGETPNDN